MKIRIILAAIALILSVICLITHHPVKAFWLFVIAIIFAFPKRGGGSSSGTSTPGQFTRRYYKSS